MRRVKGRVAVRAGSNWRSEPAAVLRGLRFAPFRLALIEFVEISQSINTSPGQPNTRD
jgi:hypothetical protein